MKADVVNGKTVRIDGCDLDVPLWNPQESQDWSTLRPDVK